MEKVLVIKEVLRGKRMKIIRFIKMTNKDKKNKIKTLIFNLFFYNGYQKKIRAKINNEDFTIISNNCFAGSIYQDLGLEYRSPTVGLFFYSDCYMKFVDNIKYYMELELDFISKSKYHDNKLSYPVGILDDVEIHFLHYTTEKKAKEKWDKRKARINYDNIFYIFSDRDGFNDENYEDFLRFNAKKILFSANEKYKSEDTIILKEFSGESQVGEITLNKWMYIYEFDICDFINREEKRRT